MTYKTSKPSSNKDRIKKLVADITNYYISLIEHENGSNDEPINILRLTTKIASRENELSSCLSAFHSNVTNIDSVVQGVINQCKADAQCKVDAKIMVKKRLISR